MAHDFQRPNLPHPTESLQNDKRYQIITRTNNRPATDVMLDTDFNYVIDGLRQLDIDIAGVEAGILPGSDAPVNANLLPTTDGEGNISWIDISDINIRASSITGSKLFPQAISIRELGDGAVTTLKLATNSVTTIKMLDFNVTANKLAPDSVITDKIVDLNVTAEKLADNSVPTDKIVDLNVTTAKIADANVTTVKIADANITTAKILDDNVTTSKIADQAVTADKIANHTITPAQIDPTLLTGAAVKADQISATSITTFTNPAVQQFHPSAAKFWCAFDGTLLGTNAPLGGYNVTSVTRNNHGAYTINFTVPFANNFFSVVVCQSSASFLDVTINSVLTRNNNFVNIQLYKSSNGAGVDETYVSVVGFGLQ